MAVRGHARARAAALRENLRGGATVDEFLDWLPEVTNAQALSVLAQLRISLSENASRC